MRRIMEYFNKLGMICCAVIATFVLVLLCFFHFKSQIDSYIEEDMRSQTEAIQESCTVLVQKEMNYLKNLTASAASILGRTDIQKGEEIINALEDYSSTSNVVRALFISVDGQAYTSYRGYLGQDDKYKCIDGVYIAQVKEPVFLQPHYDEEAGEVVLGVMAPVTIGSRRGVLISAYSMEELSSLLKESFSDESWHIGILNKNGEVVLGKNKEEFMIDTFGSLEGIEFLNSSLEGMREDFAEGVSGFSIYRVGGVTRYFTYGPVGMNNWYTIVMVREDVLRSKLTKPENYGAQLTVELVLIMLGFLCFVIANRVREQKKVRKILERAAMLDGLTGVYNRKGIEEEVNQILKTADVDTKAVLLVIDLDDFKKINDQEGHLFGDSVLRECANRLDSIFKDEGLIGRIGGDEFVVFIQDGRNPEEIKEKINRLNEHFFLFTDAGKKQEISISVGMAETGKDTGSFLMLYELADAALYRAKEAGKSRLSE